MAVVPRSNQSHHCRCSFRSWLRFSGVAIAAVAVFSSGESWSGDIVWSDEVAVDSGIRTFDPHGFKERVVFTLAGDRAIATFSDAVYTEGASGYTLPPSGGSEGSFRHFTRWSNEADSRILQIYSEGERWTVLETVTGVGLQLSQYEDARVPERAAVLDLSNEVLESARFELLETGFWVVWRSPDGVIHSSVLTDELEVVDTLVLASGADRLDVEFGSDGGVVGWTAERELYYITIDEQGRALHPARYLREVPESPLQGFSFARIDSLVLSVVANDSRTYEFRAYSVADGRLLQATVLDGFRENAGRVELTSGPEGAVFVTRSFQGVLIGRDGVPFGERLYLNERWQDSFGENYDFTAVWMGDRYFVGWSVLETETIEPTRSPSQYCYVRNFFEYRGLSLDGTLGPVQVLNNVYEPTLGQPWFDGDKVYAVLSDAHSNSLQQMQILEDGTYEFVRTVWDYGDCSDWISHRTGVVSDGKFYGLRYRYDAEWPYDPREWGVLDVVGSTAEAEFFNDLGFYWDLNVVDGNPWVVTRTSRDVEPQSTLVYRLGESEPVAEPSPRPTYDNSQILGISNRPFVVWQNDGQIIGSFVSQEQEDSLDPLQLADLPGAYLHDAAGSPSAGIVVFSLREGPLSLWAFTISESGQASPIVRLGEVGGYSAHVIWDGRQFVVTWRPATPGYEVKLARITRTGRLIDPGGISIPANVFVPGRPRIAAGDNGNLVIMYGGNRFRRLVVPTPIAPTGPFLQSLKEGVEVSWTVGERDVIRTLIERRSEDSRSGTNSFAVVGAMSRGEDPPVFLDTNVHLEELYTYRVRLIETSGQDHILGPIDHRWQEVATDSRRPRISLHPNPSSGTLSLSLSEEVPVPSDLRIVDIHGRVRSQIPASAIDALRTRRELDLSPWVHALPSGVYWIRSAEVDFVAQPLRIIR